MAHQDGDARQPFPFSSPISLPPHPPDPHPTQPPPHSHDSLPDPSATNSREPLTFVLDWAYYEAASTTRGELRTGAAAAAAGAAEETPVNGAAQQPEPNGAQEQPEGNGQQQQQQQQQQAAVDGIEQQAAAAAAAAADLTWVLRQQPEADEQSVQVLGGYALTDMEQPQHDASAAQMRERVNQPKVHRLWARRGRLLVSCYLVLGSAGGSNRCGLGFSSPVYSFSVSSCLSCIPPLLCTLVLQFYQ